MQSLWQVRCCVPQLPQAPPLVSTSPGLQAPVPAQVQVVGALHMSQVPFVQCVTPEPQSLVQVRVAVLPTEASRSSQSVLAGTPSPSASVPLLMHSPR